MYGRYVRWQSKLVVFTNRNWIWQQYSAVQIMLVPYCDVHFKTAAPLIAYCCTINCYVFLSINTGDYINTFKSHILRVSWQCNIKATVRGGNIQDWITVERSVMPGNVTLQNCYDFPFKFELVWRCLTTCTIIYSCREASTPAIRPAPVAPVPGGVPTPFAALPISSASSPKPYVNSAASVSPVSKPLNRVPSPIVFPPPLPTSQDFNFQPTAKPYAQFRPAELGTFDEQEEELTAIANQVTPREWFQQAAGDGPLTVAQLVKKLSPFYGNWCCLTDCYVVPNEYSLQPSQFLRPILILSSCLNLSLASGSSHLGLLLKPYKHISSFPCSFAQQITLPLICT